MPRRTLRQAFDEKAGQLPRADLEHRGEDQQAREQGDLSENAEYKYAKEQQGLIAGRMEYLEDRISRAEVIEGLGDDADAVRLAGAVGARCTAVAGPSDIVAARSAPLRHARCSRRNRLNGM